MVGRRFAAVYLQSMFRSKTTVAHNLFEQCDGEIEIISKKSCDNIYRDNTLSRLRWFFFDASSWQSVCTVDGISFSGKAKRVPAGFGIGEDHLIIKQITLQGDGRGFSDHSGRRGFGRVGYFQAKRLHHPPLTQLLNCKGAYLELDAPALAHFATTPGRRKS